IALKDPKFEAFTKPFGGLTSGFSIAQGGGGIKPVNAHPGCWWWLDQGAYNYNPDGLPFSIDPRTHWYAGTYGQYNKLSKSGNLLGNAQDARDPRSNFVDLNVPRWP